MHDARGRVSSATRTHKLLFATYLDFSLALENHVEFVLTRVSVSGVLLSRLKTVETDEERLAFGDRGLGHFLRGEFGELGEIFNDGR